MINTPTNTPAPSAPPAPPVAANPSVDPMDKVCLDLVNVLEMLYSQEDALTEAIEAISMEENPILNPATADIIKIIFDLTGITALQEGLAKRLQEAGASEKAMATFQDFGFDQLFIEGQDPCSILDRATTEGLSDQAKLFLVSFLRDLSKAQYTFTPKDITDLNESTKNYCTNCHEFHE